MECEFRQNENLANYSTMKIGGIADFIFLPKNFRQVLEAIDFANSKHLSFAILGNGSNTLCSSFGFKGVVICTKNMRDYEFLPVKFKKSSKSLFTYKNTNNHNKKYSRFYHCHSAQSASEASRLEASSEVEESPKSNKYLIKKQDTKFAQSFQKTLKPMVKQSHLVVRSFSGMSLPLLSNLVSQKSFSGLEFACSIPATLGGAVKMNAGAFNGQMSDIIYRVLIYNIKSKQLYYKYNEKLDNKSLKLCQIFFNEQNINSKLLNFDYRRSSILDNEFIISVDCIFSKNNKEEIAKTIKNNINIRSSTQNVGKPSLGSVFKRGEIVPAKVIEDLGLKGFSVGGAMVSKVHSGFVVNNNNATSQDVYKLLKIIQHIICKNCKSMVQYEIKFLGEPNGNRNNEK